VWDAKLITPTATAGGLCGGGGTLTTESPVWFGLIGPTNAADPYYMTAGQKHLAYDSGQEFTPTGGAERRLYLAERDAETHYGKALENWTQDTVVGSGGVDHVDVHPCDDAIGSNEATDQEHRVYLIRAAERDPNVVDNDVVAYRLGMDGEYVCVSDYLDDKIGTVKMWALGSAAIPPGWAIANGTANSVANGGTEINLTGRFIRAAAVAGAKGGHDTHTHFLFVEVDPHAAADLEHDHAAVTDVGPHSVEQLIHNHEMHTVVTGTLSGATESWYGTEECTRGPMGQVDGALVTTDCSSTAKPWGPLFHSAYTDVLVDGQSELSHTADGYAVEASHLPKYVDLIFIERINNSA
jgi:hypothetical protein